MSSISAAVTSNPTLRVLGIIALLSEESPRKLTPKELGDRLGIAKSTCAIILSELCASGYLIQEHGSARFGLGMRITEAAHIAGKHHDTASLLVQNRASLHSELNLPLSIIQKSRRSIIVVSCVAPWNPLMRTGARRPLQPPLGACFAAFSQATEQAKWIRNAQILEGNSRPETRAELLRKLDVITQLGFEINLTTEAESVFFNNQTAHAGSSDPIAVDASRHLYRRHLLNSEFLPDDFSEANKYSVNRLVIPVRNQENEVDACLELWTAGKSYTGKELLDLYQRTCDLITSYGNQTGSSTTTGITRSVAS